MTAKTLSGTISALNGQVFNTFDALEVTTVTLQITGTWVGTLTFQTSNDKTNWVSKNLVNTTNSTVATNTTGNAIFTSDIGARYFRVIATAWTSGASDIVAIFTVKPQTSIYNPSVTISGTPTVTANLGTGGTSATSIGKAEDAAAASGDTGIAVFGVRVPTTPAAQTSAAGDYGSIAISSEGKLVVSVGAADELAWQSSPVTLTTTSSTSIKASAGAGLRNYLTDITIANTSATGVRVDILDGATVIRSFWVPATSTVWQTFDMALKGTAATALNAQLSAAVTDVRVSVNGYIGV